MSKAGRTAEHGESSRLRWTEFASPEAEEDDGRDVVEGLSATPKWLPTRFFYDDRGSVLFERITRLPEYYPTRTELAILEGRAREISSETGPVEVIELGSGSARKTRALLDAYHSDGRRLRYMPVDVSAGIVRDSSTALIERYPELDVWALVGTYEQALAELPSAANDPRMAVFLGSTIGNLTAAQLADFLGTVHRALGRGSWFLVGMDLQKPVDVLEAAYNDSEGITAQFNLNMLRHLNERYDGDFDLAGFSHVAYYDREEQQIEMYLESVAEQRVSLRALDLAADFAQGERIHTEISRKFNLPDIVETFARYGFEEVRHWTDPKEWFALVLFRAN